MLLVTFSAPMGITPPVIAFGLGVAGLLVGLTVETDQGAGPGLSVLG